MSMKRTVNGNKVVKQRKEHIELNLRQATDKLDRERLISRINATETYNNRSEETKARQLQAQTSKQEAKERLGEVKTIIEKSLNPQAGSGDAEQNNAGLEEKLIASFEEIGIEKTMQKYKTQLEAFKDVSSEYENLQVSVGQGGVNHPYNVFLYNLACHYPKFIPYLPSTCFTLGRRDPLPLSNLNINELRTLETRLEADNIFSSSVFKNRYLKFFPNHINEMKDITSIGYALSLDPTCYQKLNGEIRRAFQQNPNPMATIVKAAPEVIEYFTKDELNLLANNFTSIVGVSIKKHPAILNSLPKNFFAKYNPKYVFSTVRRNQLKPEIEPYLSKFPELKQYFDSIQAKPVVGV